MIRFNQMRRLGGSCHERNKRKDFDWRAARWMKQRGGE